MFRMMLKPKIYHATVTQCDLKYVNSLPVDGDLMDVDDLLPVELVHLVDINYGSQLETYVIEGPSGSGINGAAACLVQNGELVIASAAVPDEEVAKLVPSVVFMDEQNRVVARDGALASAPADAGLIAGDMVDAG